MAGLVAEPRTQPLGIPYKSRVLCPVGSTGDSRKLFPLPEGHICVWTEHRLTLGTDGCGCFESHHLQFSHPGGHELSIQAPLTFYKFTLHHFTCAEDWFGLTQRNTKGIFAFARQSENSSRQAFGFAASYRGAICPERQEGGHHAPSPRAILSFSASGLALSRL